MMSLNMRVKSAALAVAMVASSHSFCAQVAVSNAATAAVKSVANCISSNKIVSAVVLAMVIGEIRIMTQRRVKHDYTNWREDVVALLNSYNIFDAASRATIIEFLDKYWAGAIVKLDDTTTRTKLEDGSVFTIKGKKLTQKPSGVMGLFDAYVLQQAKKLTDYIVPIAGLYLLVLNPSENFNFNCAKMQPAANDPNKSKVMEIRIVS